MPISPRARFVISDHPLTFKNGQIFCNSSMTLYRFSKCDLLEKSHFRIYLIFSSCSQILSASGESVDFLSGCRLKQYKGSHYTFFALITSWKLCCYVLWAVKENQIARSLKNQKNSQKSNKSQKF